MCSHHSRNSAIIRYNKMIYIHIYPDYWQTIAPDSLQEKDGGTVGVSVFVQRDADQVRDAFRMDLPIRADTERRRVTQTALYDGTSPLVMPDPAEPFRAGTLSRTIVAARDPRLLAVVESLSYLDAYVHGCLEQRVSKLYPAIALKDLLE